MDVDKEMMHHTKPNWIHLWHGRYRYELNINLDIVRQITYFTIALMDTIRSEWLVVEEDPKKKRTFRFEVWQFKQDWVVRFLLLFR